MGEFWALVLGSALGILGGVFGNLFSHWLSTRKELRKEKLDADLNVLQYCNKLKIFDSSLTDDTKYDDVAKMLSMLYLYSSDKVISEYKKILELAQDLFKISDEGKKEELREKINVHIDVMAAQMKKELKLENKRSKEILSLTLDKKNKEKK